ncbi:deoxyribonuclease TATDN1 [Sphaeroforma arctica JP610]|uniref:Deoxyribonuclease TATDN1 n=1 Tax=Sphaeroforma arctica JP610 TaxID=667725 RepID=A0A0L0FXZ3_9EUKA|nr:deoxyribonuclease TATDN1 [Sphaeroforma arctica JP610]KNC81700.1 deoxyribonuclease TATDN1 [Sphaeroforma arctica JP610]|eukprot:XP_014155602.1 deoxyribonuclease TATDN1 [Sphaeroforma arctica JP610]
MMQRARTAGVVHMIVTGGSVSDAKKALELAKTNDMLTCTVGCHPTRCSEFLKDGDGESGGPERYYQQLEELIKAGGTKVVAIGECGLDYDRLHFCPKETQLVYFEKQIELAVNSGLPMFLHCRAAHADFLDIMRRHHGRISGGVVHSFDGTEVEAAEFIKMGLFIGINGCSLKTPESLTVLKSIPVEKLMIETDAPWCDIRRTHASFEHTDVSSLPVQKKKERWEHGCMIKGRNEPCTLRNVLEVVASVKGLDIFDAAECIFKTTNDLFFPAEAKK